MKTFTVGPENPEFTPYNQVSDYLKYAIMTAEDARFMTHRGFMEKAFVKSAIQNLKQRPTEFTVERNIRLPMYGMQLQDKWLGKGHPWGSS